MFYFYCPLDLKRSIQSKVISGNVGSHVLFKNVWYNTQNIRTIHRSWGKVRLALRKNKRLRSSFDIAFFRCRMLKICRQMYLNLVVTIRKLEKACSLSGRPKKLSITTILTVFAFSYLRRHCYSYYCFILSL